MSDYNFFSEYQKKKKLELNPSSAYFWGGIIILICIIAIAGALARNYVLTSQIESIESSIAQIKSDADYVRANELQQSLDAMSEYETEADRALEKFQQSQIIDTELISALLKTVPTNSTVVSFGMQGTGFGMTCNVPSRKVASELLLNLENTDLCENIKLNSVSLNETGDGYVVSLDATLKAGESE